MMKTWMKILIASSMLSVAQLSIAAIDFAPNVDKREVIYDENGINRLDRDGEPGKTLTDAPRHSNSMRHSHRKEDVGSKANAITNDNLILSNEAQGNTIEEF